MWKKVAKINHEEYEVLKALDDKWRWIARDNDTILWVYENEPRKYGFCESVDSDLFQFIQWGDENPFSIAELIEEYEKESEETEVKKDIEWLKEELNYFIKSEVLDEREIGFELAVGEFIDLLNQLDESETLSEYWIEQKSIDTHVDTLSGDVQVTLRLDDLQSIIVPKQGLPVIPQFVADYLKGKEEYALYELLDNDFIYDNHDALARWLYDNDERTNKEREISLVLAQKYGYEVEEEPLYRARLKVITNGFIASYLRTQSSEAEDRLKTLEIGRKYIHEDDRHLSEFTEGELKRLDIWGSNQWEIEEVEE